VAVIGYLLMVDRLLSMLAGALPQSVMQISLSGDADTDVRKTVYLTSQHQMSEKQLFI